MQADFPMWIGGSSEAAIKRTARVGTGWQAGAETPELVGSVIAGIKSALLATGRTIDEDHYGAAFAFRFGGPGDPGVSKVMEQYRARTGRDPRDTFAMGDAEVILRRLKDYVEVGASKFILRPIADGDVEMLAQTRRLIEEVLPAVAAYWPKPRKVNL
jgi:alkanesulfonate monooxygenase SsuD/methylene tetrahydromethanopterin reductase-like flavin-dependent oxidoreductase (luciferase family)